MFVLWGGFISVAIVIVICGTKLSKYGDIIAEKTGLGRAWIGLVLLASITSLPELITGISSVALAGLPNIAAGDIMGSCVFNLMILAMLDPLDKVSPIFSKVGRSNLLSAGFGILLLGIASVSIIIAPLIPSFRHIGAYTPVILVVYIVGMRLVYFYEKRTIREAVAEAAGRYEDIPFSRAVVMYAINAVIVVAVATTLPFIAGGIAETTGLGKSFVGTAFVAITTSMPELVVSIAAMRIGAHDLATGNILGSNMFNIAILAVDDIAYTGGPLLTHISGAHAVTAIFAVVMTAIAIISMTYRPDKKTIFSGRMGWDSVSMMAIGLISMYIVYLMG